MKQCRIEGCNDKVHGHGLCDFHCTRLRKHGDPLAGGPKNIVGGASGFCRIDGCGLKALSLNLCTKHYAKFKKFGDPLGGTFNDGRSAKWHPNKDGYIFKWDPCSPYAGSNQIVYQHRQVMGEIIGRPLREKESVHHKNGDRSDNRRSNLELWVKSQPAGQRVQDKVKWARDILREYGKLF